MVKITVGLPPRNYRQVVGIPINAVMKKRLVMKIMLPRPGNQYGPVENRLPKEVVGYGGQAGPGWRPGCPLLALARPCLLFPSYDIVPTLYRVASDVTL